MAIKKFDKPEKNPNEGENYDELEAVKASAFSPWVNKDNEAPQKHGKKAWSASGGSEGKYTNQQELAEALLVRATEGYRTAEELVKLYDRAVKNPTRGNVVAYTKAIQEAVGGDKDVTEALVSILVATLCSTLGGGSRR